MTATATALVCPSCSDSRPLQVFRRVEAVSSEELWVCGNCYGFWGTEAALAAGIVDARTDHPALRQVVGPRRCRACFGHLKPDGICAKCGESAPARICPACKTTMARVTQNGLQLDECSSCRGRWFDTGELCALHGIVPPQGLAASTVDETKAPSEMDIILQALSILSRIFLPL